MRSVPSDRLSATLALLRVPGVGRVRANRLIAHFDSATRVFQTEISRLEQVSSISRGVASEIAAFTEFGAASAEADEIRQKGWQVSFPGDDRYPDGWTKLPDAPPVIFSLGQPLPRDQQAVAIVGTRHCTDTGRSFTHRLAGEICDAGLMVASGMAQGIDAAAHRGALERGGFTAAIWGTPLSQVFPASNRALAREIEARGIIYSEYTPNAEVRDINFPERNRLIAGMSEAVVVVEAGDKSGALVTADLALEQGKELFAIPGGVMQEQSRGTNRLIKAGAHLLTCVDDLFAQLPRLRGRVVARESRQKFDLTPPEEQLVNLLSDEPQQIDYLARTLQLPIADLAQYLLALELRGIVQEVAGKRFILVP